MRWAGHGAQLRDLKPPLWPQSSNSIYLQKKRNHHCNAAASYPSGNNSACPAFSRVSWILCRISSERAQAIVIPFSNAAVCFHLIKKADL